MRILFHHRARASDAQRLHILEMARAFRELGHCVEMVSVVRTGEEPADVSWQARGTAWQAVVHRIPLAYEIVQLAYNIVGLPLLLWKALRGSPDLIYERYAMFNLSGVCVAALLSKPIVLEVNSPLALEQGRDGHILAVQLGCWVEQWVCNAATKVIVVTESLRRIMIGNGVRPGQLVVMHNGVDPTRFCAPPNGSSLRHRLGIENKVVIGFVGSFRNWHGLHLLLNAFHLGRFATRGAVLLLVGDGPERKDLQRRIGELELENHVIVTGALHHSVIPEYLNIIDVAVQPAANEYCCPLKILEYMALARPIVAPRQENIQELLRDGEAVFFAPGDAGALSRALSELLEDPRRAGRLGMDARSALYARDLLWVRNAEQVIHLVCSSPEVACSC